MSKLKKELIKLGAANPSLRSNLRPVLAELEKTSAIPRPLKAVADMIDRKMEEIDSALERYERNSKQEMGDGYQHDDGRDNTMNQYNDMMDRLDRALSALNEPSPSFRAKW